MSPFRWKIQIYVSLVQHNKIHPQGCHKAAERYWPNISSKLSIFSRWCFLFNFKIHLCMLMTFAFSLQGYSVYFSEWFDGTEKKTECCAIQDSMSLSAWEREVFITLAVVVACTICPTCNRLPSQTHMDLHINNFFLVGQNDFYMYDQTHQLSLCLSYNYITNRVIWRSNGTGGNMIFCHLFFKHGQSESCFILVYFGWDTIRVCQAAAMIGITSR